MNQPADIARLLKLRKATRAVAEQLTDRLRSHLASLSPLLRPRSVFGKHLHGDNRQSARGEDQAFEKLRELYTQLASGQTYSLPREVESPLETQPTSLQLVPAEYDYRADVDGESKQVSVTCPLRWVLFPDGHTPEDLRELVSKQKSATGSDLRTYVLQYLIHHVTVSQRPAITDLLRHLRFPVRTDVLPSCGELPVIIVDSPVATVRASDDVIMQSTELSGTSRFEEVIDLDSIVAMVDPVKDEVCQLAAQQGVNIADVADTTE